MTKKLDIIIPAYNAWNTLGRTLSSIAMQTLASEVKVTIINDCDPQGSYSSIYTKFSDLLNIEEIILPINQGPGIAKQHGLDNTQADYVMFLDADDTLVNAFVLQHMLHGIITNKACEIYGDWYIENENGELETTEGKRTSINGGIYSREFLKRFDIHFNAARFHEDSFFAKYVEYYLQLYNLPALHFEEKVMVYHYTPTSICKSISDENYTMTVIESWFSNMGELIGILEAKKAKLHDLKVSCLIEMYMDYNYIYRTQRDRLNDLLALQKDFITEVYTDLPTADECMDKWDDIGKNDTVVLIDRDIRTLVPPFISFEDYVDLIQGE